MPTIIKETADWVALEKPPSLVVHDVPGEKHAGATLVDWLRSNIPDIQSNFPADDPRPGIVHRLDADTSGIILVAKNPTAQQVLQDQFRQRTMEKTYVALVLGRVDHGGTLTGGIVRTGADTEHRVKRLSFSWEKRQPKPAETAYDPAEYYADRQARTYTLLNLEPKTGRTHQLRVQLQDAGWPIIGDQTYTTKESRDAGQSLGLRRQFLHAHKLRFQDPTTNQAQEIESPLPGELQAVLDQLKTTT